MTKTEERSTTLVESRPEVQVEERRGQVSTIEERRPITELVEPSRFVRWLGWIAGLVVVIGTAGLIWWVTTMGPSIASIDPHQSPEILRTQLVDMGPYLEDIDPHQSPEITRTQLVEIGPQIEDLDPHVSPEIIRDR